ncbi:hypothetical protein FE257_011323 [Aspergillus nanangensis]|uniref:Peptidase C45 hydrolase domain-containing protein n=1 Tax=Aspergillus nanangensis TaxID=2582783 RepID=A0AAD4CHD4_ASPNN|nr:hypothetical protein FE257_011323 [Aspergillus nanangensis]
MKQILCEGSPYEIGHAHGKGSMKEIKRGIAFYAALFIEKAGLNWSEVRALASEFDGVIRTKWPRYYEELEGVAKGAGRDLLDIIALNVRSEIVFGRFSDGCTSLYCQGKEYAYMGQNWDWLEDQKANLIQLTIHQANLPAIHMVTEAGIIGKIGYNSSGVGVCFNAIRAKGVDKNRLPAHLGLRLALESTSAEAAAKSLEDIGMASSAYILMGDAATAIGLEFTSTTFARLPVNDHGFVAHSNHMRLHHRDIYEPKWLEDSPVRIKTMEHNVLQAGELSWDVFGELFEDESNYPCSISRAAEGASDIATLFNIAVDLKRKTAVVKEDMVPSDQDGYKSQSVLELMSLKGKVTVVTGAARGIGLALARGAGELGSDIAVLDALQEPSEDLASWGLGVRVGYYRTDVTKFDQLTETFRKINEDFGGIDNCITAAGIVLDKPFLEHQWEESARILNVNVMGTLFCAQLAAKAMQAQNRGGSIVMIASNAAYGALPSRTMAVYGASKGAITSLTRALAVELAQFGIRVNSVSPGFIATEMIMDVSRQDANLWKTFNSTPPLQRVGARQDLKGIVGYLLSDAAAYTTGTDVVVDGGLNCGRA